MIELTRLNGNKIVLNADLIRYTESSPDTVLTLVTGEKLIVRESSLEVVNLIKLYKAEILRTAWPDSATALAVRGAADATMQHHEHVMDGE